MRRNDLTNVVPREVAPISWFGGDNLVPRGFRLNQGDGVERSGSNNSSKEGIVVPLKKDNLFLISDGDKIAIILI
jgi:hypothetical protein